MTEMLNMQTMINGQIEQGEGVRKEAEEIQTEK